MNMEIKFRGRHSDNGVWLYGFLTHNKETGKSWIGSFAFGNYYFSEVETSSVGQYTSLKDKNGKEIYEGDIWKNENEINEVIWYWDSWCYRNYHAEALPLGQNGNPYINGGLLDIEIIGNKYENPELL